MNPTELMNEIMQLLTHDIKKELRDQGHYNTGRLDKTIETHVRILSTAVIGQIFMENYWAYMENGVPANRIPYSRGSGAKTSKYIDGMIKYFKSKGLRLKEAKSAAFATANKHKTEGMPTANSYNFSYNNKRTGFMTEVQDRNMDFIEELLGEQFDMQIAQIINRVASRAA